MVKSLKSCLALLLAVVMLFGTVAMAAEKTTWTGSVDLMGTVLDGVFSSVTDEDGCQVFSLDVSKDGKALIRNLFAQISGKLSAEAGASNTPTAPAHPEIVFGEDSLGTYKLTPEAITSLVQSLVLNFLSSQGIPQQLISDIGEYINSPVFEVDGSGLKYMLQLCTDKFAEMLDSSGFVKSISDNKGKHTVISFTFDELGTFVTSYLNWLQGDARLFFTLMNLYVWDYLGTVVSNGTRMLFVKNLFSSVAVLSQQVTRLYRQITDSNVEIVIVKNGFTADVVFKVSGVNFHITASFDGKKFEVNCNIYDDDNALTFVLNADRKGLQADFAYKRRDIEQISFKAVIGNGLDVSYNNLVTGINFALTLGEKSHLYYYNRRYDALTVDVYFDVWNSSRYFDVNLYGKVSIYRTLEMPFDLNLYIDRYSSSATVSGSLFRYDRLINLDGEINLASYRKSGNLTFSCMDTRQTYKSSISFNANEMHVDIKLPYHFYYYLKEDLAYAYIRSPRAFYLKYDRDMNYGKGLTVDFQMGVEEEAGIHVWGKTDANGLEIEYISDLNAAPSSGKLVLNAADFTSAIDITVEDVVCSLKGTPVFTPYCREYGFDGVCVNADGEEIPFGLKAGIRALEPDDDPIHGIVYADTWAFTETNNAGGSVEFLIGDTVFDLVVKYVVSGVEKNIAKLSFAMNREKGETVPHVNGIDISTLLGMLPQFPKILNF